MVNKRAGQSGTVLCATMLHVKYEWKTKQIELKLKTVNPPPQRSKALAGRAIYSVTFLLIFLEIFASVFGRPCLPDETIYLPVNG